MLYYCPVWCSILLAVASACGSCGVEGEARFAGMDNTCSRITSNVKNTRNGRAIMSLNNISRPYTCQSITTYLISKLAQPPHDLKSASKSTHSKPFSNHAEYVAGREDFDPA